MHYKKRRSLYFQGLAEINNLGFKKSYLPVKIKSLLYTSLTRSKILYGFENFNIKDKDLSETLYHPVDPRAPLDARSHISQRVYYVSCIIYALRLSQTSLSFIITP
jgi:hypothetical protein